MKKHIALFIVTLTTIVGTAFAASYSTEATMTRQKDKNTYTVVVRVSRLVEQGGKLTEQLIQQPRVISSPGHPASMYVGLQAPNPNYQKEENVSVDVAWPEAGKSGFALCTVVVNLGDKTVSKSKLQVIVDEPAQETKMQQPADDKDMILPGRRMSAHQVVELALSQLPQSSGYRCEFKDGVWEILEVQQGVWGVSSRTTNADGKISVESTNATRVVLRVRDADGKVEQVKKP